MGIERFLPVSVIQLHVIPIAAAPGVGAVGNGDDAVRGGQNGRPARRSDVRPAMVGGFSGEGVCPPAEGGGDGVLLRERPPG